MPQKCQTHRFWDIKYENFKNEIIVNMDLKENHETLSLSKF